MDRIAVIGSSGQLGTDLVNALRIAGRREVVPLGHDLVECTAVESVRKALLPIRPQVVINCAAFVRVDDCEDHPKEAFETNALGALHVARACAEFDALCVYVSTDYVFDGSKSTAYTEDDIPCPINVYGASKLAGEQLVRQSARRWLIVRTASLFGRTGARGKGGNFIETVIRKAKADEALKVVNDIVMSPTYTVDAARAIVQILQSNTTGLLHLSNQGSCSWYEFARAALETINLRARMEPVDSLSYVTKAARPKNSALRNEKLCRILDVPLRSWQDALKAYLLEKSHLAGVPI
jgi:dTDP-4-dehydrorhamnose reductase